MSIIVHKQFFPSFALAGQDQTPVCLYTVLSVNDEVEDCAAYQGVGPSNADDSLIERIRAGGRKILEADARDLFPDIEACSLRYRR